MGLHYVPRRYLANFADPEWPGTVWVHDSQLEFPPRRLPIKSVAQAPKFYTDATERRLTKEVETPANNLIARIVRSRLGRDGIVDKAWLTEEERLTLATYAMTMLRRVPYFRRWAREIADEEMPGIVARITEGIHASITQLEELGRLDADQAAERRRQVARVEARFLQEGSPLVDERITDPFPSETIIGAVYEMTWRVVISAGPQFFITSDNPAFYFRSKGYGLGGPQAEFCLPLSTTHSLHGSWRPNRFGKLAYLKADQKIVREFNKRLASQTDRFAFYHQPAAWLTAIIARPSSGFMRVVFD